jgi:hypothetical protein
MAAGARSPARRGVARKRAFSNTTMWFPLRQAVRLRRAIFPCVAVRTMLMKPRCSSERRHHCSCLETSGNQTSKTSRLSLVRPSIGEPSMRD